MKPTLDAHAQSVADEVLRQEQAARRHLVVALSGAHAYGFASPDSDLDLKAIHIAPTRMLLGLSEPPSTYDRAEFLQGVEIDYTSNEVATALRGILKGNGNFLERVLGAHQLLVDPELGDLVPLVRDALSRRFYGHYRGFARQQASALERSGTAKNLLYILRTTLTGTHLLRSSELRVDLNENLQDYGYEDARELIERKSAGEHTTLDSAVLTRWQRRVERAFTLLDEAHASSRLPDEAPNSEALEAWLIDLRTREL